MRAGLSENLSKESIAKRSLDERLTSYRKLKARFGSLVLASVVRSTPTEAEVMLAAADLSTWNFTFTVEKEPPHHLASVTFKDRVMQGGHGGGYSH